MRDARRVEIVASAPATSRAIAERHLVRRVPGEPVDAGSPVDPSQREVRRTFAVFDDARSVSVDDEPSDVDEIGQRAGERQRCVPRLASERRAVRRVVRARDLQRDVRPVAAQRLVHRAGRAAAGDAQEPICDWQLR